MVAVCEFAHLAHGAFISHVLIGTQACLFEISRECECKRGLPHSFKLTQRGPERFQFRSVVLTVVVILPVVTLPVHLVSLIVFIMVSWVLVVVIEIIIS